MGDELLKKTGAGNLFMVFASRRSWSAAAGRAPDGDDQGTGRLRSDDGDGPASSDGRLGDGFVDTAYNGESSSCGRRTPRAGPTVRAAEEGAASGDRRDGVGEHCTGDESGIRSTGYGADRGEGDQPLWDQVLQVDDVRGA